MATCKICGGIDKKWPMDWTNWICQACEKDENRTYIDPAMRDDARDSGCCPYCETLLLVQFGGFVCPQCERVY